MKYKITPIRKDFLVKAREAKLDDQNQAVVKQVALGGEPCRDVLRRARKGEGLILASYCPFSKPGPYKEYGAIFLLANQSDEKVNYEKLPLPKNEDTDYLGANFVLRAYNKSEFIFDARLVNPTNADKVAEEFFNNDEVDFVIARYTAYGCYSFRLDRKQPNLTPS